MPIARRVVLHFPGFEPLDAKRHRERYSHTVAMAAQLWNFSVDVGPLEDGDGRFRVETHASGWRTVSSIQMFDHDWLIAKLAARPTISRILHGCRSGVRVVLEGGAIAYFKHAWRFGLFFVVPFLMLALALLASLGIALYPAWLSLPIWHYPIGALLGLAFFRLAFLPWSARFHMMHLFSDWEMAVAVARLDRADIDDWLERCADRMRTALAQEADEYLITSHSMGANIAVHVLGMLLEREPHLLKGKRVVFCTLGGAVLQCAFLRSADVLRARVGRIARTPEVLWFEVQCLTDPVNFYKTRVATLTGHADAPQPKIVMVRIKNMLTAERNRRVKRDMMRIHRQYVLASDRRTNFDFSLLTAGPLPAETFAEGSQEPVPPFASALGDGDGPGGVCATSEPR